MAHRRPNRGLLHQSVQVGGAAGTGVITGLREPVVQGDRVQRLVGVRESGQVIEKKRMGGPIPGGGGCEFEDLTKKFVGAPPVGGGEDRAEHGLFSGEVMWGFGACRGDGCECHNGRAFLSVEWGGSTCLAAGCRPFFVSRVLGVAGAEVSEVGPLIGAYAFELGEKRLDVAGCRGDGAHAAGEGFAAVDAASWALAGGLCADVGEVVPEGVGVAAVDPLVDAGDRGAALGGLVADVGDDGAGFVLGGGVVGEAVEDDADGAVLGCLGAGCL